MQERLPFQKSKGRRSDARIEFDSFRDKAEAKIRDEGAKIPGIRTLEKYMGFDVRPTEDSADTVEAFFGSKSMFREDLDGNVAVETGPSLVYSFGPTGHIGVVLYPSKSKLASVRESLLFLAVGRYTAHQLLNRVRSDLRCMSAYGYVTSVDAEATWGERLLVRWLRWTKPLHIGGEFVRGGAIPRAGIWAFIQDASFDVLKFLFYIAAVLLATRYFGKETVLWLVGGGGSVCQADT